MMGREYCEDDTIIGRERESQSTGRKLNLVNIFK